MRARHNSHDGCVASWQQRSDQRAFLGQKGFGYEKERIVSGTFFIAV
jgi:hypothetical protein